MLGLLGKKKGRPPSDYACADLEPRIQKHERILREKKRSKGHLKESRDRLALLQAEYDNRCKPGSPSGPPGVGEDVQAVIDAVYGTPGAGGSAGTVAGGTVPQPGVVMTPSGPVLMSAGVPAPSSPVGISPNHLYLLLGVGAVALGAAFLLGRK